MFSLFIDSNIWLLDTNSYMMNSVENTTLSLDS